MKFRSNPTEIRGSISALVTPFSDAGAVDHDSLGRLIGWQLAEGAHGISVGGSTGEPWAQSVDERVAVLRTAAREINDAVPLVAGTGAENIDTVLALTEAAQGCGADIALVVTPYYARPGQDGLLAWYDVVCREFPGMPIVAYNVPDRTAVDIAPETLAQLRRRHDNFVGLKESSEDLDRFSETLARCGRDFLVWIGSESHCLPLLTLGGSGFLGALGNLAPRALSDMYEHWTAGRPDQALDLHYRLRPLVKVLFVTRNPGPAKHVLARWGRIATGGVRPPLTSPSADAGAAISALLAEGRSVLDPETGESRHRSRLDEG